MTQTSIKQLFDLHGKVAIVTGSAKGIGQAIASRLAEAGASLAIADTDADGAASTVEHIRASGGKAKAFQADVSSAQETEHVVRSTVEAFGRLDILVNNAGIFPMAPFLQVTESLFDKVLALNLRGAFFFAQAAAKHMSAAKQGGAIVNISSIDAFHPTGGLAPYDASKAGLVMLTKSLAIELAPSGIRVNSICPGGVLTPGAKASMNQMSGGKPADDVLLNFTARIPLRRMGSPDDIACAALFLCTQASSYMTGSTVVVDGGFTLS
jgi:2-dehydro-3-deoxy-D-gluconate 5-dehydrogenase